MLSFYDELMTEVHNKKNQEEDTRGKISISDRDSHYQNEYSWDQYFISIAYMVSMRSKDPSTKVGAVIVTGDNQVCSTGYNGFPRGVIDAMSRYHERECKYLIGNHAEENAILHCARIGISAFGSVLYSQWIPCVGCAKSIVQVGIKRVVYHERFPGNHAQNYGEWDKSIRLSKQIMAEAGVRVDSYDGSVLSLQGFYNGQQFSI